MAIDDIAGFRLALRPGIASDPHMTDSRQAQPSMVHILSGDQPPAGTMGGITPAFEPFARLKARISWGLPSLNPTKERFESAVDPLEGMLGCLSGEWCGVHLSHRRQIPTLSPSGLTLPSPPAKLRSGWSTRSDLGM
jgi:hypothetical protein